MEISEEEIEKKIKEMGNLISRDVAISLLKKEKPKNLKLKEIEDGFRKVSISAKVIGILPTDVFYSGKKRKVILLNDGTATKKLNLWNEQILKFLDISIGDELSFSSIYQRNGELYLGYNCKINMIKRARFYNVSNLEFGYINVEGVISDIVGYEKVGEKQAFIFYLSDGSNRVKSIIWEGQDRGEFLKEGMILRLENVRFSGNLNIYLSTRLTVKKKREGIKGRINEIFSKDDKFIIVIDDNSFSLSRNEIKHIFGPVPDDVSMETFSKLQSLVLKNKVCFLYKEKENIKLAVK